MLWPAVTQARLARPLKVVPSHQREIFPTLSPTSTDRDVMAVGPNDECGTANCAVPKTRGTVVLGYRLESRLAKAVNLRAIELVLITRRPCVILPSTSGNCHARSPGIRIDSF